MERGQEVFVASKCQGCHVVKGQGVDFGPDLTHVGSAYTADKLAALGRNSQSVNPQASMPPFNELSNSDLQALVAYLLTLK